MAFAQFTGHPVQTNSGAGIASFGASIAGGITAGVERRDRNAAREDMQAHEMEMAKQGYTFRSQSEQAAWDRQDRKELATKAERADFADGAWAMMKQQAPGLIDQETDEKFKSSSLGGKEGLLNGGMAALKRHLEQQKEDEGGGNLTAVPITDETGKVYGHQFVTPKGKVYGYQPVPKDTGVTPPSMEELDALGLEVTGFDTDSGYKYGKKAAPKDEPPPKVQLFRSPDGKTESKIWDPKTRRWVPAETTGEAGAGARVTRKDALNW